MPETPHSMVCRQVRQWDGEDIRTWHFAQLVWSVENEEQMGPVRIFGCGVVAKLKFCLAGCHSGYARCKLTTR